MNVIAEIKFDNLKLFFEQSKNNSEMEKGAVVKFVEESSLELVEDVLSELEILLKMRSSTEILEQTLQNLGLNLQGKDKLSDPNGFIQKLDTEMNKAYVDVLAALVEESDKI
jgi:hypothetical protein